MPALPAVANVARVDLEWSDPAEALIVSRFFWKYSGGPPANADALAIATSIYNEAVTEFIPLLNPGLNLIGCRVTDLGSSTGADATYAHTTAGSRGGALVPANVCVLVNHLIGRRYRGGKPRSYLPFGSTSDFAVGNNQAWATSFLTSVQSAYNTWVTAVNTYTSGTTSMVNPCNVSYYEGFTSVQNPVTLRWRNVPKQRAIPLVDTVNSSAFPSRIASQRRRIVR